MTDHTIDRRRHAAARHVELVPWPAEEEHRRLLAILGEPRVVLVSPGAVAPEPADELELWVPEDAGGEVVAKAVATLQRSIRRNDDPVPTLDDDGLLWFRGRWVAISVHQVPVVDLLVRNFRRVVRRDQINSRYHSGGGSNSDASVRTQLRRIAQRLPQVGLALHTVHGRGVMLARADGPLLNS
jgi:hypothetical protein